MKANRKRIKLMRSVAIASCVAGLAAEHRRCDAAAPRSALELLEPGSASTAPITGGRTIAGATRTAPRSASQADGLRADSVSSQSKTISSASGPAMTPAGSKYANAWAAYTRNQSSAAYVLPATHTTDVQSSPPGSTPVAAPSEVVREVPTVTQRQRAHACHRARFRGARNCAARHRLRPYTRRVGPASMNGTLLGLPGVPLPTRGSRNGAPEAIPALRFVLEERCSLDCHAEFSE